MARPKLEQEDLMIKLADVVRARGFEGTSMSELARATGLEKASLYHRFPGGKEEIVQAVVAHINAWIAERVLAPLQGTGTPAQRVRTAATALREFYGGGTKACMLETLSLPAGSEQMRSSLRSSAAALLNGFAAVARDGGVPAALARKRAEQAIIEIEGSLILARVVGETKAFLRVLERLPAQLTQLTP